MFPFCLPALHHLSSVVDWEPEARISAQEGDRMELSAPLRSS